VAAVTVAARLATARAALAALNDLGPPARDPVAGDARLWRFAVAFEALRAASRQLLVERYGPSQRTPDGTIRALGGLGLIDAASEARLLDAAAFAAGLVETVARDGPDTVSAALPGHAEALSAWSAGLEDAARTLVR